MNFFKVGQFTTFEKILGGISKTLNIVNQTIPIYNQAKPMIHKTRNILRLFQEIATTNNKSTSKKSIKTEIKKTDNNGINSPVFFS